MNFKIIIFLHAPFSYKPPLESAQLSLCSSKTARYNYVLSLHLLGGGMFGYPLSLYLSLVSLLFLQYRYFDFQINHPPVLVIVLYSYTAREYVNSSWINVKCLYFENQYNIENQAFCWKGLIELTQFTQYEPTTW